MSLSDATQNEQKQDAENKKEKHARDEFQFIHRRPFVRFLLLSTRCRPSSGEQNNDCDKSSENDK